MDDFSITQYGKPLDKSIYTIDLEKKFFSSKAINLVLDFSDLEGWTFYTGNSCTFKAHSKCVFKTGNSCTFKAHSKCVFKTGENCTFHTGSGCTFDTADACMFKTYYECTFDTGDFCNFNIAWACTFDVGDVCTLSLYDINSHKFKIGEGYEVYEHGIIVDRKDKKHYVLTKELIKMLQIKNG